MMKKLLATVLTLLLVCATARASLNCDGGASGTRRIDMASSATLDALDPLTVLLWVRPTTFTGANGVLYSKGATDPTEKRMTVIATTGTIRVVIDRATTDMTYDTSTALTVDVWTFVAITFNSANGANELANVYIGTLSALATEAAYTSRTDGSGAVVSEATEAARWGNSAGSAANFMGHFGIGQIVNRELTLGEVQQWQFRPRNITGAVVLHPFGYNGTGTQADLTGNGNAGTVTGCVASSNPPLGPFFALQRPYPALYEMSGI